MMKRCLFLLVPIFMFSCAEKSTTATKETLEQAIVDFNRAFEDADVEKLGQMITSNYVHTNGSWKSFGREKWLEYMEARKERIENGDLRMDVYEMKDLNIEMHGNSAFVTGKFHLTGLENGEPFDKEVRISNFWLIDEGQWKRAGFHDTRIESE